MPGTFGVLTPGTFPILSPRTPTCDCYSPDSIDTLLPTPKTKLSLDTDYFSIPVTFDGQADCRGRMNDFVMELPHRPKKASIRDPSCGSSLALIQIVTPEELEQSTAMATPNQDRSEASSSATPPFNQDADPLVYNEYGELVNQSTLHIPTQPQDMTTTQLIRVINKAYHHDLRDKMGEIILEEMDGKVSSVVDDCALKEHHLTSWIFQSPASSKTVEMAFPTTDGIIVMPPPGPPRILCLGCGSGTWCFLVKSVNPNWVVHGVDDTNHWLCVHKDVPFKDFMSASSQENGQDYFARTDSLDLNPQFVVRNINTLTNHSNPLPIASYSLVRGRQVFGKVESYKSFLDSVRLLLQPDGVVEFLEVDPRPRIPFVGPYREPIIARKTQPARISDRFVDSDMAHNVPGWSARVSEELNATLRPRDGIPAANLKEWLEGAGFYDVKEVIIPLPIGGPTSSGQKLLHLLLYQLELQNSIPKLRAELPPVEIEELESGHYHLNLHVVTGRKPNLPRTGDLLQGGGRMEMTPSTYDAMARLNDTKSAQWKRFDFLARQNDLAEMTGMVKSIWRYVGPSTPPSVKIE